VNAVRDGRGWIPLAEHPVGAVIARYATRSFVARDPDGSGLRLRYEVRPLGADAAGHATAPRPAALRAWATFGPHTEGPPGHAHGGAMAAVLDEAMGLAVWLAHRAAVAAHLEADFREPIPLGATLLVETEVGPAEGSGRARVTSRLLGDDGTVHAEGSAVFVLLAARHAARFTGGGA
jgi:acyl-coenzyme A thioesterase PaaI-like protein